MNYISSHSTQPFDIQKFTCTYTICVYMYFHTDHELLINYMYSDFCTERRLVIRLIDLFMILILQI